MAYLLYLPIDNYNKVRILSEDYRCLRLLLANGKTPTNFYKRLLVFRLLEIENRANHSNQFVESTKYK